MVHGCKRIPPLDRREDSFEKGHGRLEKRIYEVFDTKEMLEKWPEWRHVTRIIRVERLRKRLTQAGQVDETTQVSYYGSNCTLPATAFAQLIRNHWWCENKNHYIRDTAFQEDRTVKRVGAFNFSVLISFALNIMRLNNSHNIRGDLYLNALDFYRMIKMASLFVG